VQIDPALVSHQNGGNENRAGPITYLDGRILNAIERGCRSFQRLTGKTNLWHAAQLMNLSIIVYVLWAVMYSWRAPVCWRVAVAVFCGLLVYILTQAILKVTHRGVRDRGLSTPFPGASEPGVQQREHTKPRNGLDGRSMGNQWGVRRRAACARPHGSAGALRSRAEMPSAFAWILGAPIIATTWCWCRGLRHNEEALLDREVRFRRPQTPRTPSETAI
jgi:hypothetical protein